MRFVSISLAVVGLCSLMVSAVVAHAVLGPVSRPESAPASRSVHAPIPAWTTTVVRE